MLPTFLIIGTMKGGTTSLFYYLDEHPQIRMASKRESDFFVARRTYGRGLAWYESLYDGPPGPTIFGESSPNYTKRQIFPGVPERMHQEVPEARLIYCLRDPLERVLSHWVHNVAQGRERRPPDEALASPRENNYVLTSCYHFQLQAYLPYYDLDRILLLDSSDLRADRRTTLRRVFEFLGADPGYDSDAFDRVHHVSSVKDRPARIDRFVPSVRVRAALKSVLPRALTERRPIDGAELSAQARRGVEEVLGADADALRALTGLEFPRWSV